MYGAHGFGSFIYTQIMHHNGSFAAHGTTPYDAVNRLTHMKGVVWHSGSCNDKCPKYEYDGY